MTSSAATCSLLLLAAVLCWSPPAHSREKGFAAAFESASQKRLDQHPTWLRLGHWQRRGNGFESEVDGRDFFRSPAGKQSPRAELLATLQELFLSPELSCRFPARVRWLRSQLDAPLPSADCPAYERFLRQLSAESVSLVFATHYSGRLASMVGHTFLVVRNSRRPAMLDIAIDYGARIDTRHPMLYVAKGLTGGFRGRFAVQPFYQAVQEYHREARDLIEYEMTFSEAQRDLFLAHLWELKHTYFDYKFLTENCVYHVLAAIDIADDRWHLMDGLGFPVLPVDAIKSLMSIPDLVSRVRSWPSTQTRLRQRRLSAGETRLARALMDDPQHPLPDDPRAILDTAIDLAAIRARPALLRQLTTRRARLRTPSEPLAPARLPRPDLGHGARRLRLAIAREPDGSAALLPEFRLSFHDLLDPVVGYPQLAQLELLHLRLRLGPSAPELRELWLARVLSPNADGDRAWSVELGADRWPTVDGLVYRMGGSYGLVWQAGHVDVYGLIGGDLLRHHLLGLGATAGARLRLRDNLLVLAQARGWLYARPLAETAWELSTAVRWGITTGLGLDLGWRSQLGQHRSQVSLLFYF